MIYSFGARNYFSFKEGLRVSFEFNSKVPKSISKGRKVATVLGIKGANAAGKTNILKALSFICNFASDSFSNDEDEEIELTPFFSSEEPTDFYIDFETKGVRYIYELTATIDSVIKESLYKKINRKTLLIQRTKNKLVSRTQEMKELDLIEIKSNASIISTALKYKFKFPSGDLMNVAAFFRDVYGNVSPMGALHSDALFTVPAVSDFYFHSPEALDFAKKIIVSSDLGITDLTIHERTNPQGEKEYFPIFMHNAGCKVGEERWLTSWDESNGTMALYRRLGAYWMVLQTGGILIMDEFDIHCHNMLLPRLISLFEDDASNPHGSQFIFTAHSTEIMDALGKYRTILVNKECNESYCYRLDEIPGDLVRNDRSIAALYREGKLGGTPNL
jgi:AAA15 family ATPase/GTPase